MRKTWDRLIHSLLMVRLGQELGTDSELAQTLAASIDTVIRVIGSFFG